MTANVAEHANVGSGLSKLDSLKAEAVAMLGIGDPELHVASGNFTLATQEKARRILAERLIENAAITLGECGAVRPSKGDAERRLKRKMNQFARTARIQSRGRNSEKPVSLPIASILAASLIGWLFQRLFDWLWSKHVVSIYRPENSEAVDFRELAVAARQCGRRSIGS